MQGAISTTYVRLLYEYLQQRGLDAASLLGEPAPDASDLGLSRITMRHWAELLDRAAKLLPPQPALGLHIGAMIGPPHLGVLGYVIQCCSTLGEALLRLRQFERLVYDAEPAAMHTGADRIWLEWGLAHGKPGQLVDETAIAALVSYARKITAQGLVPIEVSFVNPPPADTAPYLEFFGCPVHFDAPATVVALQPQALQLPLLQPDPALLDILDRQAEALLAKLPRRDDFQQALQRVLVGMLRDGEPELDRAAAALACSPRTLQRRLRQRDLGFQQLLDQTRHSLAVDYLRDPRLQLSEIALLLGFSEQSAFSRAFRRWTGRTPQQMRVRR